MALYFTNTEITGIKDLFPLSSKDITGLYFADTELFTVWGEYDGTIPATYSANGDYLVDYRVYGASGGVGDRTVNLWQKDLTKNGYYSESGSFIVNSSYTSSQAVDIIGVSSITQKFRSTYPTGFFNQFAYFDENFDFISLYRQIQSGTGIKIITNTPPNNAKYVVSSNIAASTDIMLVEGSTNPEEYVPYGYKLDMSVSDGTTEVTTPVYIGDEPLGEDEYVDYGEQKVYRMVNGVLTPTDPPVPLPALPTVNGTTITDYAGQSAAVPSKFVAKYRKEGFK